MQLLMMRKILLTVVMAFTALVVNAQDGRFAVWYGVNMANVTGGKSEFKFLSIGVDYTAPLNDAFDWTVGLGYVTKGAKEWNPMFIQADGNASWKFVDNDDFRMSVLTGPYAGYVIDDDDNNNANLDVGWQAGIKAEYKQFSLRTGYEFGLIEIAKDEGIKNRNFYIRIGYSF